MCGPLLMLAGGLVSAAGTIWGGMESAKIANRNAAQYDEQARLRLEKGKYDVENALNKYERTRGQAFANIGTTGIDPKSFSDVLADSLAESSMEVQAIKFGTRAEVSGLQFQASSQREEAKAAKIGSYFGAAGQVLGAAGKFASASQNPSAGGSAGFSPWRYSINPNFSG